MLLKRPLSGASAAGQNKYVKKVMTFTEKVKLLDRLESGARVTVLVRPRSHLLYGEDTAAVRPLN